MRKARGLPTAEDYRRPGGVLWRVVLSTIIAGPSLTVPGVNVVIDFGVLRVNVFGDLVQR